MKACKELKTANKFDVCAHTPFNTLSTNDSTPFIRVCMQKVVVVVFFGRNHDFHVTEKLQQV